MSIKLRDSIAIDIFLYAVKFHKSKKLSGMLLFNLFHIGTLILAVTNMFALTSSASGLLTLTFSPHIDASPFVPRYFPNLLVQPAHLCFRSTSLSRPRSVKLILKSNYNLTLCFVQSCFNLEIVLKTHIMSVLPERAVLSQTADPCGGSLLSHVTSLPPRFQNCQKRRGALLLPACSVWPFFSLSLSLLQPALSLAHQWIKGTICLHLLLSLSLKHTHTYRDRAKIEVFVRGDSGDSSN